MQKLCKEICNAIEDKDLTLTEVAKKIGVSKQSLSKLKTKGEIGFRFLVRLSYFLFPDEQRYIMAEWCLRVNTTESIKQSFEYAASTRDISLLQKLITKYSHEKGSISEYVRIYSIIYKYMINEISGFDIISEIKKVGQVKDEPLKILVDILKCYNYFFQQKFHLMLQTAHETEKELASLGKRELFFKECYLHRISEVLQSAYLFLNHLPLARHYAFTIINADICPKTVSDASYIVGMSYLLEDEDKCLDYLQKSYDIAKTIQDEVIENEARLHLDFVKLYLNIELEGDSAPELIDYQNNKDNEIKLNSLKEVMYLKGEDDLVILFEAIANGNMEKLHEYHENFFQNFNYFFASLIAKEMKKRGDNTSWVKRAMRYTLKTEESGCFEKDFISGFTRFNDHSKWGCA